MTTNNDNDDDNADVGDGADTGEHYGDNYDE